MQAPVSDRTTYFSPRAILFGIAIANVIVILFFNLREVRYPSYCIWPWYIVSPDYYIPSILLGASILQLIPRRWSRIAAALVGLFLFAWPLVLSGNPFFAFVWFAVVQPSFGFQMLLGLALIISSVLGLKGINRGAATGGATAG